MDLICHRAARYIRETSDIACASGNLFRNKAYDLYHAELDDDVLAMTCFLKDTIYHRPVAFRNRRRNVDHAIQF